MSVIHLSLLSPRSMAVIGASDREGCIGATFWRHLRSGHSDGPEFAVDPRLTTPDGEPIHAHVAR